MPLTRYYVLLIIEQKAKGYARENRAQGAPRGLLKRAAPNLFRLDDARAGDPAAGWRDARVQEIAGIVSQLARRAAARARNGEQLQSIAGQAGVNDALAVMRPVKAPI